MIGNVVKIKKSDNLLLIEEMFGKIKAKIDIEDSLATIKKCLIKEYGIEVENIIITDSNPNGFYGMRTFYDKETSYHMLKSIKKVAEDYEEDGSREVNEDAILKKYKYRITQEKTAETKVIIHIEIDPILLWSKTINLTPAELTAVLLHEVGHYGIFAYDFINKVRTALLINMSAMGLRALTLIKVLPYSIWGAIGALILTEITVGTRCTSIRYNEETLADRFVIDRGYGVELHSVLKKLMEARYMERTDIAGFRKTEDKDIIDKSSVVFNMSISTLYQLDGRREEIRKTLALAVENVKGSPTFKNMMDEFMNVLFADIQHPRKMIDMFLKRAKIQESLEVHSDKLAEGLIDKLFGRKKAIGAKELDSLRIEVEMVNDYYDKIDVVDKIHRHIGAIVKYKEALSNEIENANISKYEKDKKSKEYQEASNIHRDLLELLDKAMSIKIVDKEYGVFVKVPKGYEG